MTKFLHQSVSLGIIASLLSACGMTKDLSEMHDSTVNMNKTTTEMNENMKQLLDKMGTMATTTTDLSDKMTAMDLKMAALPDMNQTMKSMDNKMSPLADMGKDMKVLVTKIDTLSTKMDLLTTMNQSMQDLLSAIKDMAGKMSLLTEMNQNMKDLRGDIGGMRDDMKTLVKRMDLLVTMNQSLVDVQKYIKSMNDKLDALPAMATDMKGVRSDMKGMRDDIATLTGKMDLLTTMNDNMTKLLSQITLMRASMDVLKTMNDNMTALRGDMKTMTEKMGLLQTMNDNMTKLYGEIKDMNLKMNALPEMKLAMDGLTQKMALLDTMNAVMKQMLSDLRLVFTAQHRGETLGDMEKSTDLVAKMGYAAEYMNAQTYQSWHSQIDTVEYRQELLALAIPDFFFKMHNYIQDRDKVNLLNMDATHEDLYAIAATLDFVNEIELDGLKDKDGKITKDSAPVISMNSMIEDGLRQRAELDAGRKTIYDLPQYQLHVLEFEKDAIFLLRVRQNYLKGVVYTLLETNKNGNDPSFWATLANVGKTFIWSIFGGHKAIKSNIDTQNLASAENLANTLDKAAETQRFLLEQNIDPMNYKNIDLLMDGIAQIKPKLSGTAKEFNHLQQAIQTIVELDNQKVH